MSNGNHTRTYESSDSQKKRMNRAIDWFMAKKVENQGEDDSIFPLEYKKLCVIAKANYDTLSATAHPQEIDISYAGASYEGGRGQKAMVEVKPITWLRNRGKLEETSEIAEKSREEYVIRDEV